MIDAQGFITNDEKDNVFTFASPNSAITLQNSKSFILFDSPETTKETYNYFKNMNDKTLLSHWFNAHNIISNLSTSGFVAKRLTTIVCYFEPLNISAKEIFEMA